MNYFKRPDGGVYRTSSDEPIGEGDVECSQQEIASYRLSELAESKRIEINGKRNELESAGFEYLEHTFDSDSLSVQRISITVMAAQAAIAAGSEFSIKWTCQDNSTIELSAEQVLSMPVALATHAATLHAEATQLKDDISGIVGSDGSIDEKLEAIAAISWPVHSNKS